MDLRRNKWMVVCLLVVAGGWGMWRLERGGAGPAGEPGPFSYGAARPVLPGQLPAGGGAPGRAAAAVAAKELALRLSNTARPAGELVNDPRAILLANALIDTGRPLDLSIPKHLAAGGDPGVYIVQARGPINAAFCMLLASAGATEETFKNYIPNNAYLARVSPAAAESLKGSPLVQAVIPYEPYYKIQASLLGAAVDQRPLPEGAVLNLGLFAASAPQTIAEIEKLGGVILARDSSPFGPVVRVEAPAEWTALASLPGVQIVEPFHRRVHANDLSRVALGVATNTLTTTANYLGLDGHNVLVAVDDSGIDATHPDFGAGRVLGQTAADLLDTDGHGTFVAGEIAGNGAASLSPTAVGSVLAAHNFGSVSNADFRGKAALAKLFSMDLNNSDGALQAGAALTNALISNNSWNDEGDNTYNLDAASYDAATRDALPLVTGSQPVLFVFSAGNAGHGDDSSDPGGGSRDSIQAPGTAKDVITVGAIQEMRSITNAVTNADGTVSQRWFPETSTSYRIAGFSSRGNVGIGIEGPYGRFKPDVVAPGTFIVSTRSAQWDSAAYFYQNPTNYDIQTFPGVTVNAGALWLNGFPIVPNGAIGVNVTVSPNANSPNPFPTNPIYFAMVGSPFPGTLPAPISIPNQVNIPSDGGLTIDDILNNETFYGFNYGVSNTTRSPISFDLTTIIITTNSLDNHLLVLSNLNNSIGPNYRFESGTSMAAADVSGVLALLQDFFTNTLHQTPSPVLLKAMLINGARPTGAYNLQVNNAINYEGWGLVNLPDSLPTNVPAMFNGAAPSSIYIQDQSPTNALATGDRHTFALTALTNAQPLRVTLAWTDPPGDPVAAVKLVNSLELVVTNLDDPTNPVVYYGNDIPAGGTFNNAHNVTNSASVDVINNVQSVILPPPLGTNYAVAVIGRAVNVNAVSAQTNTYAANVSPSPAYAPNVVQDYALVISSGNAGTPGSFTVADNGTTANPTAGQNITGVATTNQPLLNQFVGANSPVLNATNTVSFTLNRAYGGNAVDTVGMTNQWHFYVVTNNGSAGDFTNAAFVTFLPPTLSVPRMGVFAGSPANATRPQADIDLYVTTDPQLLALSPLTLSNCVNGTQVGRSAPKGVNGVFNGASLSRGGTEYVVDTNSTPGQVYYIGVKSEDQLASEYDFMPIFSNIPFSQMNNGNEQVNGVPVPVEIPDGTPANPGVNFVLGLALYPIHVADITVTNEITHQNFGDLYGSLTHTDSGTGVDTVDVLNNHDAWGSVANQTFIYNEANTAVTGSPPVPINGPSDGPGSLQLFAGQDGTGVWRLTEVDDSLTQTGGVQNFTMLIAPQVPLTSGTTNTIPPHGVFKDFVDVPAGATNLTINATNITPAPDTINPLLMTVKFGAEPTLANADKGPVALVNGNPPGNSLSVGPTDVPPIQPGRYFVDITNQSGTAQTVFVIAVILPPNPPVATTDFAARGATALLDDAVMYSDIFVATNLPIVSLNVGILVQHPRISDLVFHLISPDGTRVLLMENRGGTSANGAGTMTVATNVVATGNTISLTNSLAGAVGDFTNGQTVAGWTVGTNQVSVVNDPLNAAPGNSNLLALASGSLSTTLTTVTGLTYSVSFAYRGPGIAGMWRGENNANDSIYGNNGTAQLVSYTAGEVGQAFVYVYNFSPPHSRISVPDQLIFQLTNSLSIDGWINPAGVTGNSGEILWRGDCRGGYDPYFFQLNGDNTLGFGVTDASGAGFALNTMASLAPNQWWHVAATLDGNTGNMSIYINGVLAARTNTAIRPFGALIPAQDPEIGVGNTGTTCWDYIPFNGDLDEISLYSRALSASEFKAIYQKGAAGKFDAAAVFPQNLAEARVTLTGQSTAMLYGANTNWQTYITTFKAVTNQTILTLTGLEPGMLLGPLVLTGPVLVTNVVTNIYYLTFTENTNLTTTPIKYAAPPFVPGTTTTNVLTDGFEQTPAGDYAGGATFGKGWTVTSNQVSVVADPANAYTGSNFLALAGGTIFTNLPTAAGQTYTLTFAYRGPGIAAWWRAESNPNDSVGGHNGSLTSGAAYTNGEVSTAFNLPGVDPNQVSTHPFPGVPAPPGPEVVVPYSSLWNLGTNSFTIDLWANFNVVPSNIGHGQGYPYDGIFISDDVLSGSYNKWWFAQDGPTLDFHFNDPSSFGPDFTVQAPFTPQTHQWYHYAITRNGNVFTIYNNGAAIRSVTDTHAIPNPNVPLEIGGGEGFYFNGLLDETSIYGRALSASEIKAIYAKGTNGKFDPSVFATSPALSLAEAQVSLNGQSQGTLLGNNTTWQVVTITFTATQNGTPLSITGLEPGMLLDAFTLTQVPGNLYYLPEQFLGVFAGESAFGDWQLEIQDDRAGAGLTNALVSWDLQFVFANTNAVPLVLGGGIGQSNQFVPAGDIAWYQIIVPATANYATNLLLFASAPVNLWFDTNNPPRANLLLLNGTGGGSALLSTTNAVNLRPPPRIYGNQTYYLGVQNPNAFTVNYGIKVNFDVAGQFSAAFSSITASSSGTTLQWTAASSAQFEMQWKDDLTQPWNTDTNVITSGDGNFTFTDDGSQTAPLGAMRFYRLVQLSP